MEPDSSRLRRSAPWGAAGRAGRPTWRCCWARPRRCRSPGRRRRSCEIRWSHRYATAPAPCRPVRGTAEFLQCHTQRVRARQGRLQQHQQAEQVQLRCRRRLIWLWPFADSP